MGGEEGREGGEGGGGGVGREEGEDREEGEWAECDKTTMTTSWARKFEEIITVSIYSVDIFPLLHLVKGKNSI